MIKVEAMENVDTAQEKLPAAVGASCCDGADRVDFIRCRACFIAAVRALHSGGYAAFGAGRHRCRAGAAGPLLCRGGCLGAGRIAGLPLWRPAAFVLGGWYSAGSRHRPVHLPV